MIMLSVCGPPSCGKTTVILRLAEIWNKQSLKTGMVKFDCLSTDDDKLCRNAGLQAKKALSGPLCPDHYYVSHVQDIFDWGLDLELDVLMTESAGLCNRCSPHLRGIYAVCVIDNLSGIGTPRKIGPMLRSADMVIVTKSDIVSQAERQVFAGRVAAVNPSAQILQVNGLTGQGAYECARLIRRQAQVVSSLADQKLRFPMPSALCSYCLGELRVGNDYQIGNIRKLILNDPGTST